MRVQRISRSRLRWFGDNAAIFVDSYRTGACDRASGYGGDGSRHGACDHDGILSSIAIGFISVGARCARESTKGGSASGRGECAGGDSVVCVGTM